MRLSTSFGLVAAVLLAAAGTARAQDGGVSLIERGTPDQGVSGAGNSARAQDAATAHFNAAGMTRLKTSQFVAGISLLDSKLKFSDRNTTGGRPPGNTNGGGYAGGTVPIGGGYLVYAMDDDVRLGLTINGMYGGSADYDDEWLGRQFVTEASFVGMNLEPAVAWKLTDKLSVGLGLNVVYAELEVEFKAAPFRGSPDIELEDADDWDFGFTVSSMYEFDDDTRVGIRYRSDVDLDLRGDAKGPPGTSLIDAAMTFPQSISVGLFHQIDERLALLTDVSWTDWSEFGYIPTTLGTASFQQDRDWKDTWRVGAGVQYALNDDVTLMTGFSYDSDPVGDGDRLPDIPASEVFRGSVGVAWKVSEAATLGFTYTLAYMNRPAVRNAALPPSGSVGLDGVYERAHLHIFGVTLTWDFGGAAGPARDDDLK
jgi:long-chain fatty acid transport protein